MGWPQIVIIAYYVLNIILAFMFHGTSVRINAGTQFLLSCLILLLLYVGGFFS